MLDAEQRDPSANITSFGDALWWACATMTTVGYGDHYPVTGGGRAVGVGLMIAGIALLGAVTATLASWFISSVAEEAADAAADAVEAANDEDEDAVLAELAALQAQVGELSRRLAGG